MRGVTVDRARLRSAAVLLITALLTLAVWWWNERPDDPVARDGGTPTPAASAPASPTSPSAGTESPERVQTGDVDPETGLRWVLEADLPPEGRDTLELIDAGGPYPFDRDGITFENREGILPDRDVGYYREFTVIDPGSFTRGPLRIVAGDRGEFYYTSDHYASFRRIQRDP